MDTGKTKVILVGNSTFPKWGGETKEIPNVDQNMDLLKKIFLDTDYFGIPNDLRHLVEIKDETSQEILLRVKHETKSFAEKDQFERLIFYYTGHGIPGEDKKLFFAAKDTIRSDYEISAVDSTRLFSYLKGFGARELIVILDCCYAAQSKENLGDADTLIIDSLPAEKAELEDYENGAYYLFAAGKDNVAKFNPKEPKKPTYFTEALLTSIQTGTEPGKDFITIGELYIQLRQEILRLKKNENPDIPDPRPVLEGEVNGFLFCKNIKFENQEDKDWLELIKDPTLKKIQVFEDKYPQTRFEAEKDEIRNRLLEGIEAIKNMKLSNDLKLANRIKSDYRDIPMIRESANKFMKDLAAKAIDDENEIEKASINIPIKLVDSENINPLTSKANNGSYETENVSISNRPANGNEEFEKQKTVDPGSYRKESSSAR